MAMAKRRQRVVTASAKLSLLSPENTLKRGYSITMDERGRVLRESDQAVTGEMMRTRLAKGAVVSRVERKEDEG
jgi:exodeoxyribonuclease VII large subunit